jgi:hypothetical protein
MLLLLPFLVPSSTKRSLHQRQGSNSGLLLNFNSVPLNTGVRRLNKSNSSPVSPVSPVSQIVPAWHIEWLISGNKHRDRN